MRQHIVPLVILMLAFNLNAQDDQYYIYNSKETSHSVIPTLLIDLRDLPSDELEEKSLTLRFSADDGQAKNPVIGWDIDLDDKKLNVFMRHVYPLKKWFPNRSFPFLGIKKTYPYFRPRILAFNFPTMEKKVGSYATGGKKVLRQEINLKARDNLHISTLPSNHVIQMDHIPISIRGEYEGIIEYRSESNSWHRSYYHIVASYLNPKLPNPRILKLSCDSLYSIDLETYVAKPTLLKKGWTVKFQLPAGENIIWDKQRLSDVDLPVANYNGAVSYQFINHREIIFIVDSDFASGTKYTFHDIPIITKNIDAGVSISVLVSPDGERFVNCGQTAHDIKVVAPELQFSKVSEKPFLTLFKNNENLVLPDLHIRSGPIKWLDDRSSASLTLLDSSHEWLNFKVIGQLRAFPYGVISPQIIKFDPLRIIDHPVSSGDSSIAQMASIRLKNKDVSISGIRFDVCVMSQNNTLTLHAPLPITIGQPFASIMENNVIIASSNNPAIKELVIKEDDHVTTLAKGDTVKYIFRDAGIKFNGNTYSFIQYPQKKLKILPNHGNEGKIEIILLESLSPGEQLSIKNIPLIIESDQSIRTTGSVEFSTLHGTSFSTLDNFTVEIVNIKIEMSRTAEFYPLSLNNYNHYTLPTVRLKNEGTANILEGKQIFISLAGDDSSKFSLDFLQVVPNPNINVNNISIQGTTLIIELPRGMGANQEFILHGLGISVPPSTPFFYQSQLSANFGSESNNILSNQTVTFGSPAFTSPYEQKFIAGGDQSQLYSIKCDFQQMPSTLQKLESITLRIPDSVPLEWNQDMKISVSTSLGKIHTIEHSFQNRKSVSIRVNGRDRETRGIGAKFELYGMSFKVPLQDILTIFSIEVSLDQGETFGIHATPQKHLISSTNRSSIDRQRVQEDFFPFEKGRKIEFVIQGNPKIKWDNRSKILDYSEYDKVMSRTKIFDPSINYSQDSRTAWITVAYDINNPPTGNTRDRLMDFGENVTITNLSLTERQNVQNSSISVRLQTLYGPVLLGTSGGQNEVDITIKDESVSVKLGLLPYSQKEQLSQTFLINWYRYRERYLPQLHFDGGDQDEYNVDNIGMDLLRLKSELNKYYHFVGEDAYYDWAYWYYAAWYKKRIRDIRGENFVNFDLDDPISNSSFISDDIQRAITYGYDIEIFGSEFRSPLDTTEVRQLRQIAFNNADHLFEQGNYLDAEDIIYQNIDLPGMDNYLKAAYYAMLGKVARAVNDRSEFPNRRLGINESYECRMYNLARNALNARLARQKLHEWNADLYNFIVNADCGRDDIEENVVRGMTTVVNNTPVQSTNQDPMQLAVSWQPAQIAELYEMSYLLQSHPVIKNSAEFQLDLGREKNASHLFNEEIEVYGGNTYTITYDAKRKSLTKTTTMITTMGLLLLWRMY